MDKSSGNLEAAVISPAGFLAGLGEGGIFSKSSRYFGRRRWGQDTSAKILCSTAVERGPAVLMASHKNASVVRNPLTQDRIVFWPSLLLSIVVCFARSGHMSSDCDNGWGREYGAKRLKYESLRSRKSDFSSCMNIFIYSSDIFSDTSTMSRRVFLKCTQGRCKRKEEC